MAEPVYCCGADGFVEGEWDAHRERISLGGLLILRQELELLAAYWRSPGLRLILTHAGTALPLAREVFQSLWPAEVYEDHMPTMSTWPPASCFGQPNFSYQSFERVTQLAVWLKQRPLLQWAARIKSQAAVVLSEYRGRLYSVHLKQQLHGGASESNANTESWYTFLVEAAKPGERGFLLLGADVLPAEFEQIPGVVRAQTLGLPLAVQLCLAGSSAGFLGMASGVCQAAILSSSRYVVFKNPKHHVAEMQRELGSADYLPFAGAGQLMWRCEDTPLNLRRALSVLEER